MRTAVVTGGAGFVGSHLAERLVHDGWSVRVIDDLSTGSEANLSGIGGGALDLVRADVRDEPALERVLDGADVVFHQAAIASVPRSVAEPVATHAVNVGGTLAVLDASRRAGVRRAVLASSCAVYGPCLSGAAHEDLPARPASPYALQKWQAERTARLYTDLYGLETVVLRYFNVYGPRQDPEGDYASVIPRFATDRLTGRTPELHGDGTQTRDFVHVADVVRANLLAADAPDADGTPLNVGSGRETSIAELLECITDVVGGGAAPRRAAAREGDVRASRADPSRAASRLGFESQVGLREGLAQTIEHLRKQLAPGRKRVGGTERS